MGVAKAEASTASQVLLVDDDEAIRETLADILREEGMSVASAEHGAAALGYLSSHELPRVIILDLMMPIMSGAEFREIQLSEPRIAGIPVIVMSATDRGGAMAAKLKADAFLPKPPSVRQLLDTIARYC